MKKKVNDLVFFDITGVSLQSGPFSQDRISTKVKKKKSMKFFEHVNAVGIIDPLA